MQKDVSRKQKGSKNRWKARRRVAIQHSKVAKQRKDFHKLSYKLAKNYGTIGFEDLRIKNMVKNHALAKSISDAGWGQLMLFTKYKAIGRGGAIRERRPSLF